MIRLSSLGDVLLCAPAIRALKRRFPDSRLDFLVASSYREAAEMLPGVDRIIEFDRQAGWRGLFRLRRLLSRRYEIIVDLQNSWRSAFLRQLCFPMMWVKSERYRFRRWLLIRFKRDFYGKPKQVADRYVEALDVLGAQGDEQGLQLVSFASDAVHPEKSVMLCPGSRHRTKQWPLKRWKELSGKLRAAGWTITVCGSKDESAMLAEIANDSRVLAGASLREVARTIQASQLVISHDSGLMHLATGFGIPVIAIFGPTVKQFGFYPYHSTNRVLEQQLPCRPCSAFGGNRCPKVHHDCMMKTNVNDVFHAVQELSGR